MAIYFVNEYNSHFKSSIVINITAHCPHCFPDSPIRRNTADARPALSGCGLLGI